jgi:hypothetical protein
LGFIAFLLAICKAIDHLGCQLHFSKLQLVLDDLLFLGATPFIAVALVHRIGI